MDALEILSGNVGLTTLTACGFVAVFVFEIRALHHAICGSICNPDPLISLSAGCDVQARQQRRQRRQRGGREWRKTATKKRCVAVPKNAEIENLELGRHKVLRVPSGIVCVRRSGCIFLQAIPFELRPCCIVI